jgi:hypothetical protein
MNHIAVTGMMLKARAAEESGRRIIYVEASNETLDQQNERVLAKALADSADYFLRYGNIDLDHISQIGRDRGIPDYHFYEIGRPLEVDGAGGRTFVKGEIYQGEGPSVERANLFWSSLTAQIPPQRWYPSVGGAVLEKAEAVGAEGKETAVRRVRWSNLGLSKTPVNTDVPEVSTIPVGVFAKCWTADGLDLRKALEAGYGTDSAGLEGGGALRRQSLEGVPLSYWDFRERVAGDLTSRKLKRPDSKTLLEHAATTYGLDRAIAAEWVERFLSDLRSGLSLRKRSA